MRAGTTPGQDLNLSMERITANRNLTNKLWNAGKFHRAAAGGPNPNPMRAGTTPGQDLNLSMERITATRNLTNKLWNAGKFIALQLEAAGEDEWAELAAVDLSEPEALAGLPLAERWVLSELHQVRGSAVLVHHSCYEDIPILCLRHSYAISAHADICCLACLMVNLLIFTVISLGLRL